MPRAKSVSELKREDEAKRFFDEYSKSGNITKSMQKIRPDLSDKSAYNKGYKILNSPLFRNVIHERVKKRDQRSVMTVEQRRQWLSDNIQDERKDMKDRLGCLKELNRMDGIGKSNILNVGSVNNITVEQKRAIAEERINDILGINMGSEFLDAEVVEHEEDDNSEEAGS